MGWYIQVAFFFYFDIMSYISYLDYQPEYKMLQETYYTKKKGTMINMIKHIHVFYSFILDIFANMEHTIQDLRDLEAKFDRTKENFQGHLATDYSELCRGLMNKRNRLDREKASFEASTDHKAHGKSVTHNMHTIHSPNPFRYNHFPAYWQD